VNFVAGACLSNFLVCGDYFIVDNAAVHHGEESEEVLNIILEQYGVHLRYLPAYSPELNPCELVFSKMKGFLRRLSMHPAPLYLKAVLASAHVTREDMEGWYKHCIHPKQILPELDYPEE